jgi:hypothetical protein
MRTTISIYRQLGKWIESIDAAYATAHPELLAATSTLTDPSTTTPETPAHSSTASFASANTSTSTPNGTFVSTQQQPSSPTNPPPSHPYLPDPSRDCHFRSGVYLGLGMSHLVLSLMPGKILAFVELFGYKGDRALGLEMLERAGGWGDGSNVVDEGQFQ